MKKIIVMLILIIVIVSTQPIQIWENFIGRYFCTMYESEIKDNIVYSVGFQSFGFDTMHDFRLTMMDWTTGEIIKDTVSAWADTVEDELRNIIITPEKIWCGGWLFGSAQYTRYYWLIQSFDFDGNGMNKITYGVNELTYRCNDCAYDEYGQVGFVGDYTSIATLSQGMLFQRWDRNGNLIKSITYDLSGSQSGQAITFNNNAYYIGGADRRHGLIVKIQDDGIQWTKRILKGNSSGITDVVWNPILDRLICIGWTKNENLQPDIWLLQLDSNGQIELDTTIKIVTCQRASAIAVDSSGYYYIVGLFMNPGTCGLLLKSDFQGNVIWHYNVPTVCECILQDVEFVNGEILITGINDDKGYIAKLSEGVGIKEKPNQIKSGKKGIYNMLGQRVHKMNKTGIYIVIDERKTKKVIVK